MKAKSKKIYIIFTTIFFTTQLFVCFFNLKNMWPISPYSLLFETQFGKLKNYKIELRSNHETKITDAYHVFPFDFTIGTIVLDKIFELDDKSKKLFFDRLLYTLENENSFYINERFSTLPKGSFNSVKITSEYYDFSNWSLGDAIYPSEVILMWDSDE